MKLNIGCGRKVLDGWLNVDLNPLEPGVKEGNICEGLEFLSDKSAQTILLDNVVEHLESIPDAIKECFRLLDDGGVLVIRTPHFSSIDSWRDPTHRWHLSIRSFDYFLKDHDGYSEAFGFTLIRRRLSFPGGLLGIFGRLSYSISPDFWEKKLAFVLRASQISVELQRK